MPIKIPNPKPDFVNRISDSSFTSRLFKQYYNSVDQEAILNEKNKIQERRNKLPFKTVPGLELKKGLQLNQLDGLNDMDDNDLYQNYCRKKYKRLVFFNDQSMTE